MPLDLKSRFCGSVYVIQCAGRIVGGPELASLEAALDLGEREFSRFVLDLSEVTRLDSMGLGLLVRHATRSSKRGGDIRLSAPPPFVVTLLNLTRLTGILQSYPTQDEAILSFLKQRSAQESQDKRGPRLLVFDPSADLCAFVRTVLTQHGFDVRTTCSFRDAKILLRVDEMDYVLVGPSTPQLSSETIASELQTFAPKASTLQLSADFKSRDALEATETLLQMLGVSLAS
jgi:anti-sigma B factor antagonist